MTAFRLPKASDNIDPAISLTLAIDEAMLWANRYLADLIRLAHWAPYLDGGTEEQQQVIVDRVLDAVLDIDAGADELHLITATLRQAARAHRLQSVQNIEAAA